MQQSSTATATPAAAGDLPAGAIERVKEAFTAFEKVMKVRRLYEPNHATRHSAEGDLTARVQRALELIDEIVLEVTPDALRCGRTPVLSEERREGAIPFRLYQDGVRSLTLARGIDQDELLRLIEILETSPDAVGRFDDDLASLLWRADLQNIRYVAVDELGLKSDQDQHPASELEQAVGNFLAAITASDGSDRDEASVRAVADRREAFELDRRRITTDIAEEADDELLAVPADTLARLRAEVEGDDAALLIRRVLDILFDLVQDRGDATLAHRTLGMDELQQMLQQLVVAALARGDLPLLDGILHRLAEGQEGPAGAMLPALRRALLDELGGEQGMTALGDALRRGYQGGPEVLLAYLSQMPASSLSALARLARSVPAGSERDVLRRVLLSRAAERPSALADFLAHVGVDEARATLRTFYRSSDEPDLVKALLHHDDPRVRFDAVKSIERVRLPDRGELIAQALDDHEHVVRGYALRLAELGRDRRALTGLVRHVDGGMLDPAERVAFLHAIAVIGGHAAADYLQRQLDQRIPWFKRSASRARHEAVRALGDVRDPAIRDLLSRGTKSKNRGFAAACRAALGGR